MKVIPAPFKLMAMIAGKDPRSLESTCHVTCPSPLGPGRARGGQVGATGLRPSQIVGSDPTAPILHPGRPVVELVSAAADAIPLAAA